jgi:hypothetical protein
MCHLQLLAIGFVITISFNKADYEVTGSPRKKVSFIGADKDFTAAYASTPTIRFRLGGLAPSNFFTDPAFLQKGWKSTCLRNAFLSIYRIKPILNAIKS